MSDRRPSRRAVESGDGAHRAADVDLGELFARVRLRQPVVVHNAGWKTHR